MGGMARPCGPAGRPDLPRELSRRRYADLRAQLFASGGSNRLPVLQFPAPRVRGLSKYPGRVLPHRATSGGRDRQDGTVRGHPWRTWRLARSMLEDARRTRPGLHAVRRFRPASRTRMAGAGLLDAAETRGPRGAAHPGASRRESRPRRSAARRYSALIGAARAASDGAAADRERSRRLQSQLRNDETSLKGDEDHFAFVALSPLSTRSRWVRA